MSDEFFEKYGSVQIQQYLYGEAVDYFTVEEMYQAFKARMRREQQPQFINSVAGAIPIGELSINYTPAMLIKQIKERN